MADASLEVADVRLRHSEEHTYVGLARPYRQVVGALIAALGNLNRQVAALGGQLAARFAAHPDAEIVRSQPGLGVVLGARVLAEFGDDPHRYATAKGRKAYAGTAPGHPVLGAAHGGGRPSGVQPAAGGRLLPVGVRLADRLAGRTALL